ncbi:MAG: VWA domain-containing protein [Bacteroidales bacterium]|nr:VWA domain-containing protein [Bacteroidales bacterium]
MENFRFANPNMLWMLLSVILLVALFVASRHITKSALNRFGNIKLLSLYIKDASEVKLRIKFILELLALICLIVAAARPQFGTKLESVKKQGIEVMVCLDISNSMLAEDIQPNRLEKAKRMLSRLLDEMENDQVGLIVFAGDAFTQLPITNDFVSAKMFLSTIDPKMVSIQGTAIGSALNLAVRSFTSKEDSQKAIILITDGENHEDDAQGAAASALEKGVHTHVIGIGSVQGALVPDDSGRSGSYRKDREGNPVTTHLDEEMARRIAAAGEGVYAHADNSNSAINAVIEELSHLQTTELESHVYADYEDQFPWFVVVALILIIIDIVVLDRANSVLRKIKIFSIMFVVLSANEVYAQKNVRAAIREGNEKYNKEEYREGEISYRQALEINPNDSVAIFNLGNSLYRQLDEEKMKEALTHYMTTAESSMKYGNKDLAAKSYYNAGNVMMAGQQYDKAIQLYKQSLKNNPRDHEARYNLVLAQKLLQKNQDQQQNQQQDQQNQEQEQQQNKEQNQDQQKPQDNQDNQNQQNQQNQQQEEQQGQMSKEQAEAILNANNRDEKDTQQKVQQKQMQQMKRKQTNRDW